MVTERVMSLGEHLEDLRKRLLWALLGLIPLFVLGLVFGGPLLQLILTPLQDALHRTDQPMTLLATSPFETVGAYLKVAIVFAMLLSTPWIILQAWLFVSPGLHHHERRFVYFLIPMSGVLTALGLVFLYEIMLPATLTFLISWGTGLVNEHPGAAHLDPAITFPGVPVLEADPPAAAIGTDALPIGSMWVNTKLSELRIAVAPTEVKGLRLTGGGAIAQQYRIGEYTDIFFMLGVILAIAFQLPLVLMILSWVGIVEPKDFAPYRKQIIFGCAIGAALLPSQDPFTMCILWAVFYGLFEFGIVLMKFVPARVVAGKTAPALIDAPAVSREPTRTARTDGNMDDEP